MMLRPAACASPTRLESIGARSIAPLCTCTSRAAPSGISLKIEPVEGGRLPPMILDRFEQDLDARLAADEFPRAGGDRMGVLGVEALLVVILLRHDLQAGVAGAEQRRQVEDGLGRVQLEGQVVDDLEIVEVAVDRLGHLLGRLVVGVLRHPLAPGVFDVLRGDRAPAVMEGDAGVELEGPGLSVIGQFPGIGDARRELAGLRIERR